MTETHCLVKKVIFIGRALQFEVRPNPFTSRVRIVFERTEDAAARIDIFDTRGRFVRKATGGATEIGRNSLIWDGRDCRAQRVPPGLYFCRLKVGDQTALRKIVLIE